LTKIRLTLALIALQLVAFSSASFAQEQFIELLRSDLQADKVAILTVSMDLNEEQSNVFWPIYRAYQLELNKLGDRRLELLRRYAKVYDALTDEDAKTLVKTMFKLEEDQTKLKKKVYGQVAKALSPAIGARFIQAEQQMQLLVQLGIAAELPLVQPIK